MTQKLSDFLLFKQVVELIINKKHLTIEGLYQIINIKASMNLGLSKVIRSNFIKINPVNKMIINTKNIPDPKWIAGFTSGEGNFDINIHKSKNKIGFQVQLRFRIYQNERDIQLMKLLIKYFGAGKIEKQLEKQMVNLTIVKFSDIINIIIPFFENNYLHGVKQLDYLDWCKVANLMKSKKHHTPEGLELIYSIKSGINRSRK